MGFFSFLFSKKQSAKRHAAPAGKPVGEVTHYYGGLGVAIVKFREPVKAGDKLAYFGATTDFSEVAASMQYDHQSIAEAKKGQEVGIKVKDKVREGDAVYRV